MVGQWKKATQEQVKTLFEGKRGPKPVAAHQEPELLLSEIGKFQMELDWLNKSPDSADNATYGISIPHTTQCHPIIVLLNKEDTRNEVL